MPNWFHHIQKCWHIPVTPTGESYTCQTWHRCHTRRLTHSFVQPRLKTSISLAALLLGSITSQSAAVDRVQWWIGNTESCANLREEGQEVTLGAAKGFGVFWIGGGFKKVF